jgi:hypothetical protein
MKNKNKNKTTTTTIWGIATESLLSYFTLQVHTSMPRSIASDRLGVRGKSRLKRYESRVSVTEGIVHLEKAIASEGIHLKVLTSEKDSKQGELMELMEKQIRTVSEQERFSEVSKSLRIVYTKRHESMERTKDHEEQLLSFQTHYAPDDLCIIMSPHRAARSDMNTVGSSAKNNVNIRPPSELSETGMTLKKRKNEAKDSSPVRTKKMKKADKA